MRNCRFCLFLLLLAVLPLSLLHMASALNPESLVGTLEKAPKSYLSESPYWEQCQLGSTVADAVRDSTGADVALVNASDLKNDLNQGTITGADILRVFGEDRTLGVALISPATLWQLLEHSVSQVVVDPDTESIVEEDSVFPGFCHLSGLTMTYDASAPAGERVLSLTLEDGSQLSKDDQTSQLSVAATTYMLEGGYSFLPLEYERLDCTLADALAEYVGTHLQLPEDDGDRISIIGIRESSIFGHISKWAIFAGCAVLAAIIGTRGVWLKKYNREFNSDEG